MSSISALTLAVAIVTFCPIAPNAEISLVVGSSSGPPPCPFSLSAILLETVLGDF